MSKWPDRPITLPLHDPIFGDDYVEVLNGVQGVVYRDARFFCNLFTVSEETMQEFLPPELKPGPKLMAAAFAAEYPNTSLGPFKEAGLLFECQIEEYHGFYAAYMYIDAMFADHTLGANRALLAGREVGFPMTLGDIRLVSEGDRFLGTVHRQGMEAMRIEANINQPGEGPPHPLLINMRAISNTDRSSYIRREICGTTMTSWVKYSRLGNGSVDFPPSADLIRNCAPVNNIMSYFTISDSVLQASKTLKVL